MLVLHKSSDQTAVVAQVLVHTLALALAQVLALMRMPVFRMDSLAFAPPAFAFAPPAFAWAPALVASSAWVPLLAGKDSAAALIALASLPVGEPPVGEHLHLGYQSIAPVGEHLHLGYQSIAPLLATLPLT